MTPDTFAAIVEPLRDPLPQRADTECDYCGKADCTERFDHDRWNRANEDTWRRR